jgi:ABC-2 type transport system permease protein
MKEVCLQVLLIVLFSAAVSSMGMLIGSFLDNINRPMQILSATSMVIFYASEPRFLHLICLNGL